MSYFKGKTVIVTGASSGIGEATAKEFLLQGAKVILVARSESKMYDAFKDFNQDSYSIYPFDLTNLDDIDSFVKMLIEKEKIGDSRFLTNRITVVIHYNGNGEDGDLERLVEDIEKEGMEAILWNLEAGDFYEN